MTTTAGERVMILSLNDPARQRLVLAAIKDFDSASFDWTRHSILCSRATVLRYEKVYLEKAAELFRVLFGRDATEPEIDAMTNL